MDDSKSETISSFVLGTPNVSVPVVGNFDANGPTEPAGGVTPLQRPGRVDHCECNRGIRTVTFGQGDDIPVPGDYDGVGHDELAVYRPSTGQYYVEPNGTTETITNPGVGSSPDLSSLVPVPGGYDPHLNAAQPPPGSEHRGGGI